MHCYHKGVSRALMPAQIYIHEIEPISAQEKQRKTRRQAYKFIKIKLHRKESFKKTLYSVRKHENAFFHLFPTMWWILIIPQSKRSHIHNAQKNQFFSATRSILVKGNANWLGCTYTSITNPPPPRAKKKSNTIINFFVFVHLFIRTTKKTS